MAGTINNNRPTTETSRTFYIPETTRLTSVLDRLCSILSLYLHSQWIVVVVVKSMTDRDELITQRGKWLFYCITFLHCFVKSFLSAEQKPHVLRRLFDSVLSRQLSLYVPSDVFVLVTAESPREDSRNLLLKNLWKFRREKYFLRVSRGAKIYFSNYYLLMFIQQEQSAEGVYGDFQGRQK